MVTLVRNLRDEVDCSNNGRTVQESKRLLMIVVRNVFQLKYGRLVRLWLS